MKKSTISYLFVILAGEAIFMLPFMIPRLFRPIMLEAWGLTNTDFGVAFASYGFFAMVSYLLGGPFADQYSPRSLISLSLIATAAGGFYLSGGPSALGLILCYAFFGISTTFLMWGALIKTTHLAGGQQQRSLAMGILDGGRGLSAAAFGTLLVVFVSFSVPSLNEAKDQFKALQIIYFATTIFIFLIAVAIWISLPNLKTSEEEPIRWSFAAALESLRNPNVGLLGVVVLGAYCGFKGIDNYATYMVNVHQVDLSQSSLFTSIVFWLRPLGAILAGASADCMHRKIRGGRFLSLFALLVIAAASQVLLAFTGQLSLSYAFFILVVSAAFAFAIRAVYFAVFGDLKIPPSLVGTTTGLVSFVGFMPDIFYGWLTGRLIDHNPGPTGFQSAFLVTATFLILGAAASFWLYQRAKAS